MNNIKNYLLNQFKEKVNLYDACCKDNGGHEGSVPAARYLTQVELIQSQLFDLFKIEVNFERHIF